MQFQQELAMIFLSTIAVDKFVENLKIEWISYPFITAFFGQANFDLENNYCKTIDYLNIHNLRESWRHNYAVFVGNVDYCRM